MASEMVMIIMMSLVIILWLTRQHVLLLVITMLDELIVMLSGASESWVYVSDSSVISEVNFFILTVVVAPDDMMVDVSLVMVSVKTSQFVCQVILNMLDILNRVMGHVMMAKVVLAEDVLMSFTWVVVLVRAVMVSMMVIEVISMMVIMVLIKVSSMAVVMVLTFSKTVKNITNMSWVHVVLRIMLGGRVLLFLSKAFLKRMMRCFILMRRCSELCLVVLIVIVPLVKSVDSSITMIFIDSAIGALVQNLSSMHFVVLMTGLVFFFMWVVGGVICMRLVVIIVPVSVLVMIEVIFLVVWCFVMVFVTDVMWGFVMVFLASVVWGFMVVALPFVRLLTPLLVIIPAAVEWLLVGLVGSVVWGFVMVFAASVMWSFVMFIVAEVLCGFVIFIVAEVLCGFFVADVVWGFVMVFVADVVWGFGMFIVANMVWGFGMFIVANMVWGFGMLIVANCM